MGKCITIRDSSCLIIEIFFHWDPRADSKRVLQKGPCWGWLQTAKIICVICTCFHKHGISSRIGLLTRWQLSSVLKSGIWAHLHTGSAEVPSDKCRYRRPSISVSPTVLLYCVHIHIILWNDLFSFFFIISCLPHHEFPLRTEPISAYRKSCHRLNTFGDVVTN